MENGRKVFTDRKVSIRYMMALKIVWNYIHLENYIL